jgi:peptide/nickel transport system substrate-binding protein
MAKQLSRREFLKGTAAGATTIAASSMLPGFMLDANAVSRLAAQQQLRDVPRNRTLIHAGVGGEVPNQFTDVELVNPFVPGTTRTGYQFNYEPLFYYNVYAPDNNETAWIGDSYSYNDDFTEVTIKIRSGVEWSDGTPFTVNDLAFTINMLKDHAPDLAWSGSMQQLVKDVVVEDDLTARIVLNAPNPSFVYNYFTYHFDIGIPIVPKHIWENQDPLTFTNFDLEKGWPVVTGPYKLVLSSPEQKILDRRDDWWAAKSGFHELPAPERVIYLPGNDENQLVQLMLTDAADSTLTLTSRNIQAVLGGNPNVDTWSGLEPPYGYTDWWPLGLGVNNQIEPFNMREVRWAINRIIDRDQLNEFAYAGAGVKNIFPWPGFASMKKYEDALEPILAEYPIDKYDPSESESLMMEAGYTKDGEGFWVKDGKRIEMVVETFNVFQDVTPVLVEQLRRGGFDASFKMVADFFTRLPIGQVTAFTFGHGGGTRDPFPTLELYHSKNSAPPGERSNQFYRWENADFDALVDQMSLVSPDSTEFMGLFTQAMEIWIRELPDIPLAQFFHRNPRNNRYWTNWPSKENPYINDANWHRTFGLVLINLKAVE